MDQAQTVVGQQFNIIKSLPGTVTTYWPAFFTFTAVQYATSMIMSLVPDVYGTPGIILGAGLNGARNVINFATWDAVKLNTMAK